MPPPIKNPIPLNPLARYLGRAKLPALPPLPPPSSSAISSPPGALPPNVHRPDLRVKHFPKALDPDRSLAYSKKIEKHRKPTSLGYRVFAIFCYAACIYIAYYLILVRDWDDRVWGGKWRRDRLKRLALHRDLTPEEAAILARPEPPDRYIMSPWHMIRQIPMNNAINKEIRKARREHYLEDQRLEKLGMDVPLRGTKINYSKYAGEQTQTTPGFREEDDDMDWAAIVGLEEAE